MAATAILLMLAGTSLIGTGFISLSSAPLLPEDLRYIWGSARISSPRLGRALRRGSATRSASWAATFSRPVSWLQLWRRRHFAGVSGFLGRWFIGGVVSIGWMSAVDFAIDSDFKHVLSGMAMVWAGSLLMFCLEKGRQPS
jgi:hypothetical protein